VTFRAHWHDAPLIEGVASTRSRPLKYLIRRFLTSGIAAGRGGFRWGVAIGEPLGWMRRGGVAVVAGMNRHAVEPASDARRREAAEPFNAESAPTRRLGSW
jgi:hypothetical protein